MKWFMNLSCLCALLFVAGTVSAGKHDPAGSLTPVPDSIGASVYDPTAAPAPGICDDLAADLNEAYFLLAELQGDLGGLQTTAENANQAWLDATLLPLETPNRQQIIDDAWAAKLAADNAVISKLNDIADTETIIANLLVFWAQHNCM